MQVVDGIAARRPAQRTPVHITKRRPAMFYPGRQCRVPTARRLIRRYLDTPLSVVTGFLPGGGPCRLTHFRRFFPAVDEPNSGQHSIDASHRPRRHRRPPPRRCATAAPPPRPSGIAAADGPLSLGHRGQVPRSRRPGRLRTGRRIRAVSRAASTADSAVRPIRRSRLRDRTDAQTYLPSSRLPVAWCQLGADLMVTSFRASPVCADRSNRQAAIVVSPLFPGRM